MLVLCDRVCFEGVASGFLAYVQVRDAKQATWAQKRHAHAWT